MLRKSLVLLAAMCSCASVARAGDKPLYAPIPAWVKPAPAIDAAKLTDADPILLMLDQQQRIGEGQVEIYGDMAMRMASPQVLAQSGTLPVEWDPGKGDLTIHAVEIIRGAERIDVLASGKRFQVLQREQQLERAMLNGRLTATLSVEGLRVGDVVRMTFSMTRKDPALHGHFQAVAALLAEPVKLQYGRVRLLWPDSAKTQWRTYLKTGDLAPVQGPPGYRELTLTLPVAKPADMPKDAPARYSPLPILEATDYAGWSDLSKDMASLYRTEGTIKPGGPVAAEVARIAAATTDPRVRAAMALQLVQDKVRYLFRGMDDGDYVPQAPEHSWSVRYGDCKAKSMLLLAMLRALGVDAEAVLVSTDLGDRLPDRLPMPGAFNHVIVRAVIGGESLWLDGTGGGARLADIGDVPPFRHGLPLREAGAELIALPAKPNARPITDAEIEVDNSASRFLPAIYKARVTVRGGSAELMNTIAVQGGKDALNDTIDGVLGPFLNSPETVDRSFTYDASTATGVVTASGITYPSWTLQHGRYETTLDSTVSGISFEPDRARPAWRGIPVSSGDYADVRSRTRTRLPDGGKGYAVEGGRTLPATLAGRVLNRDVKVEGEWVTVVDRTVSGISEVAPAEIPAARAALAQAKGRLLKVAAPAGDPPMYLEVDSAKKRKALDPILAVYAKQIAEKPEDAESYTDRAWFFERIRDYKSALRDYDKAIALDPSSGNYLSRSRVHSSLGDDKSALADARAALEADPGESGTVSRVAHLLADTGKRDEAITMIAEYIDQGGDDEHSYRSVQASLLADGGRVDEGLATLDKAIASRPGDPALLNSRCWLKGTHNVQLPSALKDCTKSIELSDNPSAALDSRAMVYFRMNRMEEARADLDAALEASPAQSASLFLRGVIRKRAGEARGEEDLAEARGFAPRIDEDYAKYGIKP